MSILLTVIGLSIVVFLHELGHMLAAKKAGVGVSEFSVGMGPKLLKYKYGETLYSFRLLPLGGFVRLVGLDDDENKNAPNAYPNKTVMQRFWTIFWGPLANVILGFVIFLGIFSFQGVPVTDTMVVAGVTPGFPTESVGLMKDDLIKKVNDVELNSVQQLTAFLNENEGRPVTITFERNNSLQIVDVTPRLHQGNYVVGLVFKARFDRGSMFQVIGHSLKMTQVYVMSVFEGIGMLISGQASFSDMTGPIGIIQFASFNLDKGIMYFFNVMAMISISLGVINLFPFPVLDGGHIVMLMIEAVRGKALSQKWFVLVNNIGTAMLITLMVFIIVNDIRFWQDRVTLFKTILGQ